MPRRSATDVAVARRAILDVAVDETSVRGFAGASIGLLAERTQMSKSGLLRHFGDKQTLELETLRAGLDRFVDEVWTPCEDEPAGRARLLAVCDAWLSYFERRVLPGGCLMTTALIEFDALDGPMHDAVAEARVRWLRTLEGEASTARANGELPPESDPADVAFTINALATAANNAYVLDHDPAALEQARRLMRTTLSV